MPLPGGTAQRKISPVFALRGRHLLAIDVVCVCMAFILAMALRLDAPSELFRAFLIRFAWLVLPLLAIRIGINLYFRLYQRLWRYASVEEMQAIVLATTAGTVVFAVVVLALGPAEGWPAYGFPRSAIAIEWLLSTALLGGSRFSLRTTQAGRWVAGRRFHAGGTPDLQRVLIVGAGDAGAAAAKELQARPRLAMELAGFVDDDPNKRGKWIYGVKVVGNRADLPDLVARMGITTVIVAMPSAPGSIIREVLQDCEKISVNVMTVPGIAELISGKVTYSQIRPVQVEDLLRREPATLDLAEMASFIEGATVMVTGAGGSIGSELCRQITAFRPAQMILLGRGENSIYQIQMEMEGSANGDSPTVPVIADTRDLPRIKGVMERYRPSVVFHAAAHKHVPLMESNPGEAIATNVFGTRNMLEASVEHGVDRFVLVSTDKAVNPTNVMGASKRIAEMLLQRTAEQCGRRYVAVRFGNVLGSRGSVVPLFRRQIENGGPVTVTHRDITRYFMTIPEAVQLIIQASAMGRGGEIFVLDMGTPIRIYDLARDLIRLSGLEPGEDIEIKVTGLRPGEKLHEELFTSAEQRISTRNSRIFVSALQPIGTERLDAALAELAGLLAGGEGDDRRLRSAIGAIVPEFHQAGGTSACGQANP